jgi:hypothetical protein
MRANLLRFYFKNQQMKTWQKLVKKGHTLGALKIHRMTIQRIPKHHKTKGKGMVVNEHSFFSLTMSI